MTPAGDLAWLLLPVAAASGWLLARRTDRRQDAPPAERCESHPGYFKGLNYLLNEQPDRAIDVFVEMLRVDSETVETHLALGSLFRRRGEMERAIRLHQNLIARPNLNPEQRAEALHQLGIDYMRAGLFDRAENLFRELKATPGQVRPALEHLRTIYEQEKEWRACLSVLDELDPLLPAPLSLERAHYLCELAVRARANGHLPDAEGLLHKALQADPQCVRARHLLAQLAMEGGRSAEAVHGFLEIATQHAGYVPEIVDELVTALREQEDREAVAAHLDWVLARYPGASVALAKAELLAEEGGREAAVDFLNQHLQQQPSLQVLLRVIEWQGPGEAAGGDALQALREPIDRLLETRLCYRCERCGFEAKTHHWQCPSCRSWSSVRRRAQLD